MGQGAIVINRVIPSALVRVKLGVFVSRNYAMSDRLAHLNQLLENLEAQLAGLEKALALAPLEDKARLRLLIQEKQREIQPYTEEKAQLEGQKSVQSPVVPSVAHQSVSPMATNSAEPLNVFISYAHADEVLKDELVVHLATLKRQGKIKAWQDRDIEAGAEWDQEIKANLEAAEIILLLITPRFLASDYCFDLEMQRAVDRHDAGTARVIPIILKPCDWQGTPFSKLQGLPKDCKPVNKWDDRDEAFLNVVQGLRKAVESLQAKKAQG